MLKNKNDLSVVMYTLCGFLFVVVARVTGASVEYSVDGSVDDSDFQYRLEKEPAYWRNVAQTELAEALGEQHVMGPASNIILFLGDGMGPTTVTAGRILAGQIQGKKGEEVKLSFDKFPFTGLSRTYNVDTQVTDSAASGTAFLTGVKTNQGVLGLSGHAPRGDCDSAQGREVTSVLTWFMDAGRSVGVVTNTRVTHATPAAAYAHTPERDWEDDSELPRGSQCKDIAAQLVEDNPGIHVIMGGGRKGFFPASQPNPDPTSSRKGARLDNKDLIKQWKSDKASRGATHQFVYDTPGLEAVDPHNTDYLLGLFADSQMDYDQDRNKTKQPSLPAMTEKAIKILQKNKKGFFLLVEGGRIDHGHHESKASQALHDVVTFAEAVGVADRLTAREDTLIVVTADHSHTMSLAGYSKRGNSILGQANPWNRTKDFKPYTTILYSNGPGYNDRANITDVDTEQKNYRQESGVPMRSETHGGEDVGIYARGPQAFLYTGVHEQNYIPTVMAYAACVGDYAEEHQNCAKFNRLNQFRRSQAGNTSSPRLTATTLVTLVTLVALVARWL